MNNEVKPLNLIEKKAPGGTYRKANIALGLSVVGLTAAYPFQSSFWGGLLTSGCSAALVGGLADWFAVNALFRRPLGVPAGKVFRTEIIPRNRERIFQALSSMVENELLSQETLKNKLETYDFSAPAIAIWSTLDKDRFQLMLTQCLWQIQESLIVSSMDLENESVALLEQESLRHEQVIPFVEKALVNVLESEEGKETISALLENLSHWVQDTEVHLWLSRWLEKSIERYISQNPSRRFLAMFLPEPSKLALNIQNQLTDYLLEDQTTTEVLEWLKNLVNTSGYITDYLTESITDIQTDNNPSITSNLYSKIRQSLTADLVEKLQAPEGTFVISKQLLRSLEEGVLALSESQEKRDRFNKYVQGALIPLLVNKHRKIGEIVQEGLEKYSNEMLVELIESKAGDDLQMIRINGSVVGGLAGMLIYLVSHFLV